MTVFVDTSALLPLPNPDDPDFGVATQVWNGIVARREQAVTTNYVLVETISLMQRRLGIDAARHFHAAVAPLLDIEWVGPRMHERGMAALLAAGSRRLSLVDCVSFEVMRERGLGTAFAFDDDFERQGFELLT
ncbi:MAG: PIN domain-containing protein [Chloroflexi bacterium]|nr:PIN domain-containing protein [Chloroflexota bacterium]